MSRRVSCTAPVFFLNAVCYLSFLELVDRFCTLPFYPNMALLVMRKNTPVANIYSFKEF